MKNLYLSELRNYIKTVESEFGINKTDIVDIKSATGASKSTVAADLYHTMVKPEKSNVVFYVARASSDVDHQQYGIRVYPRDVIFVHNDCDFGEVFEGCSNLTNVEFLTHWFWFDEETSDELTDKDSRIFIEKLLTGTMADINIDRDRTDYLIKKREAAAEKRLADKANNEAKAAAKMEEPKKNKKASSKNSTKIVAEPKAKLAAKKSEPKANATSEPEKQETMTDAIKFHYDPLMTPAALIEKFIQFYDINVDNPLDGIADTLQYICNNPSNKNAIDMACMLYHLLTMSTAMSNAYTAKEIEVNQLRSDIDKLNEDIDHYQDIAISYKYGNTNNRYRASIKISDQYVIGNIKRRSYVVTVVDTFNNDTVVQYRTSNKNHTTVGFILDNYGIYANISTGDKEHAQE